jgi:hypothetical protein
MRIPTWLKAVPEALFGLYLIFVAGVLGILCYGVIPKYLLSMTGARARVVGGVLGFAVVLAAWWFADLVGFRAWARKWGIIHREDVTSAKILSILAKAETSKDLGMVRHARRVLAKARRRYPSTVICEHIDKPILETEQRLRSDIVNPDKLPQ